MRLVNKAYGLPNPPSWHEKMIGGINNAVTWLRKIFKARNQEPVRQPTLESQKSVSSGDRHPWTLAHGFYALMGGFAFEIPEQLPESKKFLPSHTKETWFVDFNGIRLLMKHEEYRGVLPNLSEEEIKSKSKANGLAKALVCIQALWFIAQCITRLAQRMPISLLELNTFGHAICALLIYVLWWEKPFEVDYPTMIEGQILWDIRACLWMESNRSPAAKEFSNKCVACLEGLDWFRTLAKLRKELIQSRSTYREIHLLVARQFHDDFLTVYKIMATIHHARSKSHNTS